MIGKDVCLVWNEGTDVKRGERGVHKGLKGGI